MKQLVSYNLELRDNSKSEINIHLGFSLLLEFKNYLGKVLGLLNINSKVLNC
jgi:hypothetical protein